MEPPVFGVSSEQTVSLKALVDRANNRVIFAESNEDFIDVLLSFLTLPMGIFIRRTRDQPPAVDVGCMSNLYASVENLDVRHLRTQECKTMLLCPRNAAETHCRRLKLKIDDGETYGYFLCSHDCTSSRYKLLSHHRNARCGCGEPMCREFNLTIPDLEKSESGVFVKELTRLLISDDLRLMPSSTAAILSLLSQLGITDGSTIEERTITVGVNEVLTLLKCSLASKTPLTETLLEHKPVPQLSEEDSKKGSSVQSLMERAEPDVAQKIHVKIFVSKSKEIVCYAEAGEDFVDLLFSFLTLLLGFVVKEMEGSPFKGCIDRLYASVKDLDAEHHMKSHECKAMLVSPQVAPGFRYESQPFHVEEASYPTYYYGFGPPSPGGFGPPSPGPFGPPSPGPSNVSVCGLSICPSFGLPVILTGPSNVSGRGQSSRPSSGMPVILSVKDPKSDYKEAKNGGGFVKGPTMFTITDNLVITPVSPISDISVLSKLKVPFNDIEEHVVPVGYEEASRLLVASLVSESALTNAFIRRERMQE